MRRSDPQLVSYESVLPRLRTGDIFLFHGGSGISLKVERGTRSRFSHAAMVIRPRPNAAPWIWQAGPTKIVRDPLTHTAHGGAQLGDLREALLLMTNPAYGDQPYLRQLHYKRSPDFERVAKFIVADIEGRPFPSMNQMMAQWKKGQGRRSESDRTLFCAELVAETYMRLGLLLLSPPPNAYSPKTFSTAYHRLHLRNGATLGPELKIAAPRK